MTVYFDNVELLFWNHKFMTTKKKKKVEILT